MNKNLTVYAKSKQHKGHFELIIGLSFDNQQPYYKVIQRLNIIQPHYNSQNVLVVLGYLYKHYKSYNIKICLVRHNIVQLIHQLPALHRDHWPVSKLSSSDMYKQARETNTTISFNKIPSNYAIHIQNYKRIFNAMPFFYGGISFDYVSSKTHIMQQLTHVLQNQIGYLPPTKAYLQNRKNHRNFKIVINLEPNLKRDFLLICKRQHMDYKNFLHHSIILYIKSHKNLLQSDTINIGQPVQSSPISNNSLKSSNSSSNHNIKSSTSSSTFSKSSAKSSKSSSTGKFANLKSSHSYFKKA